MGSLLLGGCSYKTMITFKEDTAILEGNTKANATINLEKKEARIEQISEPIWQRLFPKNLNIDK